MSSSWKQLEEKHRLYDLSALISDLKKHGIKEVRFKGNRNSASKTSLIESLDLSNAPEVATLKLNLGLLSSSSALPSYFFKALEDDLLDLEHFNEFIGFFDHILLNEYTKNIVPENNSNLFPDWKQHINFYLKQLTFDTPSTLNWFFTLLFPELDVTVQRCLEKVKITQENFCLNKGALASSSTLGGYSFSTKSKFKVYLFSNTTFHTTESKYWKDIIQERVFSSILDDSIPLLISLIIRNKPEALTLNDKPTLGYDSLKKSPINYKEIPIQLYE